MQFVFVMQLGINQYPGFYLPFGQSLMPKFAMNTSYHKIQRKTFRNFFLRISGKDHSIWHHAMYNSPDSGLQKNGCCSNDWKHSHYSSWHHNKWAIAVLTINYSLAIKKRAALFKIKWGGQEKAVMANLCCHIPVTQGIRSKFIWIIVIKFCHQPITSQPFLGCPLIFHSFFTLAILNRATSFLQLGWFYVDIAFFL